ncbi:2-hydroxychromene-2-carboxylate isomerase [Pusillimonas sp. ANT_WB101]|uniref:2-hydroxychromene-2-carboxylate isomerase n=1 Tax=Pusillimonas sp. ANT_WB101 TaxID=2597356 RepID=UPI0011EE737F|nr:2-hydroxychromene-2-carboxylate isomerase [Pusillimonas sp. ANT_WB101]KAA0910606.1 2-hydroxychromene-2-carboxylate isomerase [Pusillimonas sp. ANT_WB101]
MTKHLDFYFDFSSPYGYLASTQIEALAAELGRSVNWRPILLGPMFQAMGSVPLIQVPLKGEYALHDFARTASLFDIPYATPESFPISTLAAARATVFLRGQSMELAADFAKRIFSAYFAQGKDIREGPVVLDVAAQAGADVEAVAAGMASDSIKTELKQDVADAMARGVFGSPFVIMDNEAFWGFDRFPHIKMWAANQQSAN